MRNFFLLITLICSISLTAKTSTRNSKINLFSPTSIKFSNEKIITNPKSLLKAANYSLQYFSSKKSFYKKLIKSKLFEKDLFTSEQAKKTLEFIIKTIKDDKKNNVKKFRINDPKFLEKNFTFIRWKGDQKAAKRDKAFIPKWFDKGKLAPGKIKLTSYAIFKTKGNYKKTPKTPYPLYEIKSRRFRETVRKKYSKHKILTGIFEKKEFKNDLKPLVWLSRKDLEEAIMQGSIIVQMPNNKERLFNIFVSNDFPYDKKIRNNWKQEKYWFFKEIKDKKNIHERKLLQLAKLGGIALAGDIENIGLGKIIALKYKNPHTKVEEMHLGVLADRGSAFSNNLYQIDLFAGTFDTKKDFKKFIGQFPPSVNAYLLKAK